MDETIETGETIFLGKLLIYNRLLKIGETK
jgi:hypothetical protein